MYNDDDRRYKQWETEDTIHNAMYIMKANQPINSELFAYCQTQLNSGKLKFLIDESVAKNKLMSQSQGKKMTTLQRADYLRPYVETSILKSQMMEIRPLILRRISEYFLIAGTPKMGNPQVINNFNDYPTGVESSDSKWKSPILG